MGDDVHVLTSHISDIFDDITKLEQQRVQLLNEKRQKEEYEAQLLQHKRDDLRKRQEDQAFLLSDLAAENSMINNQGDDDQMNPWTIAGIAGLVAATFTGVLI